MPDEVLLLDGGTGTELRNRGVEVPSHVTSIWSARALLDAPDAVVAVHRDYIDAGADVVTVNNYAVTPPLLAREGLADRLESLTGRAVELTRRARDEASRPARIAGSVPPLETSYRADLVGDDAQILADYRRIVAALADGVDLLLCETLASAREARAALTAARESGLETWLSFTLQGNRRDHLPSGESIAAAIDDVRDLGADAHLVNCCGANLVTFGVEALAAAGAARFGGYGHAADVTLCAEGAASDPLESLQYSPLDPDGYADAARAWVARGATIVGGCCHTGPAHTRRLRADLDGR